MSTIHQSVNHVPDGINHLVRISQEIGQIIKAISDISRQTNLLALYIRVKRPDQEIMYTITSRYV
ncbi:hypothetical protein ACINKY_06465 [Paenibacillus illinoisensis]|uniref:Histidine kinase n=1 Tax=Paenibacillus illinoisensis TaxID=59845 RepID=A0ABW8HQS9_9BACL